MHNRLSYISLPGERLAHSLSSSPSVDQGHQGGHQGVSQGGVNGALRGGEGLHRRPRPSSTYEIVSDHCSGDRGAPLGFRMSELLLDRYAAVAR